MGLGRAINVCGVGVGSVCLIDCSCGVVVYNAVRAGVQNVRGSLLMCDRGKFFFQVHDNLSFCLVSNEWFFLFFLRHNPHLKKARRPRQVMFLLFL